MSPNNEWFFVFAPANRIAYTSDESLKGGNWLKSKKEQVYDMLRGQQKKLTTSEAAIAAMDRINASHYLNELVKDQLVAKDESRPVHYWVIDEKVGHQEERLTFEHLIGADYSLKNPIQKAKAAMLYPPRGLHTLIFGETGTGKTLFAECMYCFGLHEEAIASDAPFITFNCADYAQNPQLLFAHIFGVKKGRLYRC